MKYLIIPILVVIGLLMGGYTFTRAYPHLFKPVVHAQSVYDIPLPLTPPLTPPIKLKPVTEPLNTLKVSTEYTYTTTQATPVIIQGTK